MKTQLELKNLQQLLSKMNLLNINEAYPHFAKNGVVLYLMPCEKAMVLYTKKEIEKNIRSLQNETLNLV
jgi:hypothetical protein